MLWLSSCCLFKEKHSEYLLSNSKSHPHLCLFESKGPVLILPWLFAFISTPTGWIQQGFKGKHSMSKVEVQTLKLIKVAIVSDLNILQWCLSHLPQKSRVWLKMLWLLKECVWHGSCWFIILTKSSSQVGKCVCLNIISLLRSLFWKFP